MLRWILALSNTRAIISFMYKRDWDYIKSHTFAKPPHCEAHENKTQKWKSAFFVHLVRGNEQQPSYPVLLTSLLFQMLCSWPNHARPLNCSPLQAGASPHSLDIKLLHDPASYLHFQCLLSTLRLCSLCPCCVGILSFSLLSHAPSCLWTFALAFL